MKKFLVALMVVTFVFAVVSCDSPKDYSGLKILCLGDSLTAGSGVAEEHSYPSVLSDGLGCTVLNIGAGGTTPRSYSALYWSLVPEDLSDCDYIVIMLGTNSGLTDTLDEDASAADYNDYADTNTGKYCWIIEDLMARAGGNTSFILCSCPPAICGGYVPGNVESANLVVPKIAGKYGLEFLDVNREMLQRSRHVEQLFNPDGVHFNEKGYALIARIVEDRIKKLEK